MMMHAQHNHRPANNEQLPGPQLQATTRAQRDATRAVARSPFKCDGAADGCLASEGGDSSGGSGRALDDAAIDVQAP